MTRQGRAARTATVQVLNDIIRIPNPDQDFLVEYWALEYGVRRHSVAWRVRRALRRGRKYS